MSAFKFLFQPCLLSGTLIGYYKPPTEYFYKIDFSVDSKTFKKLFSQDWEVLLQSHSSHNFFHLFSLHTPYTSSHWDILTSCWAARVPKAPPWTYFQQCLSFCTCPHISLTSVSSWFHCLKLISDLLCPLLPTYSNISFSLFNPLDK